MTQRRVVVTGLGALTPIGNNVNDFWNGLIKGTPGAAAITYFDTEKFKTKFACELEGFDPKDHLDRKEIRTNDPYVHYALVCTEEALKDADMSFENVDPYRTGVIWGSGNGGIKTFHDEVEEYAKGDGTPRFNPYFVPKIIVNMGAGVISIKYGIKGPSFTPVSACATSNSAIIEAYNYIKWNETDVMIAGGSDAAITPSGVAGFNASKALSTRNDDPQSASRPFDKDRDGFVIGEGGGALILEEYEHAVKRGAKIYAEIAGGAQTSDAYHLTATHPEGEGAIRAMKQAIEKSGLQVSDVDYVNMHATSTPLGDVSELKAIAKVFEGHTVKVSATKSMTGHLLGGAGAIEAIASIKAIETGKIPATINTKVLDEDVPNGIDILIGRSITEEVKVVLSNTFGFGGHNAAVVFRKHQV